MIHNDVPLPEHFPKTNWDSLFNRLIGFDAWVEKWKKIREEKVKQNYDTNK